MAKPKLIIVTGRPGAGKTTLSVELSAQWRLPLVSRDGVKEGLLFTLGKGHDDVPDANRTANEAFFRAVKGLLSDGVSLIIEAAFQRRLWEMYLEPLKDLADMTFILCDVSEETARRRIAARAEEDALHSYYHGTAAGGEYVEPDIGIRLIRVDTSEEVDTLALYRQVFGEE